MESELVTISDAAWGLGVSTRTIYRLLDQGALEAVRIGRARRVLVDSIDRLVDGTTDASSIKPPN